MTFQPYEDDNLKYVKNKLFAAFDLGTSSIVCAILDGETGKELMRIVDENPQAIYGKDIAARIEFSQKYGVEAMREVTLHAMARMLDQATENLGIPGRAKQITLGINAANSYIGSIVRGLPLKIKEHRFEPESLEANEIRAGRALLKIHDYGCLFSLPYIGGIIGGDTVAGIIATGMHETEELSLLIDVDTSAQFVLGNRDRRVCLAASEKGCAFDGVKISHGIYGAELLETIAEYVRDGKIDEDGILKTERDSVLVQSDVDRVKAAKTVIMSGIRYILKSYGCLGEDIQKVYLSGVFGTEMDQNAIFETGLMPLELKGKVVLSGNTSLEGAKMCVCDYELFKKSTEIARNTEHLAGFAEEHMRERYSRFGEVSLKKQNK